MFESLAPECTFIPQRGEDLGRRIFCTVQDVLALGYDSVLVIGADSPTLPPEFLERAFEIMGGSKKPLVIGPASDGGYYLIGRAAEWREELFDGIAWSTSSVLEQTLERADRLSLAVTLLPEWYDVDSNEDLDVLAADLGRAAGPDRAGRSEADHTREFLRSISLL